MEKPFFTDRLAERISFWESQGSFLSWISQHWRYTFQIVPHSSTCQFGCAPYMRVFWQVELFSVHTHRSPSAGPPCMIYAFWGPPTPLLPWKTRHRPHHSQSHFWYHSLCCSRSLHFLHFLFFLGLAGLAKGLPGNVSWKFGARVVHRPLKDMEGDLDDMDEDTHEWHGLVLGATWHCSWRWDHVSHVGCCLSRRRKRCRPPKRWRGAAVGGMT